VNKPQYKLGYGDYLRFRELVLSYSGLYFPEKKRLDLEIGLLKALQNAPKGISDPDSYYHYLQDEDQSRAAAELRRLVNLLTIGETHFFRDDAQFDALANQILPQLIAQKRTAAAAVGTHPPGKPQLRVWSAGCASGEEAYSIAILLRELIPDISNWQIFILATDINQDSLDKGKEASYTDWSFREKRAKSMQSLYFHKEGKKYRLRDDIRQMVTFARLNLIDDAFPAIHNNTISMDLILCRNVTIYFTEKITAHLVSKFYETLLPNGWLGIGHSEHSFFTYRAFVAQSFPGALMYRKTNQDGRPRSGRGRCVDEHACRLTRAARGRGRPGRGVGDPRARCLRHRPHPAHHNRGHR
jgi:chemotaxis protein methyltransferase CheR